MLGPATESFATDIEDFARELAAHRADFAAFREEFAGFRGRVETQLAFLRWLGAFTAAILVTLVGSALWLSWHASTLNQRVGALVATTRKVVERLDRIERMIFPAEPQRPAP